jgi:hypothetical protein
MPVEHYRNRPAEPDHINQQSLVLADKIVGDLLAGTARGSKLQLVALVCSDPGRGSLRHDSAQPLSYRASVEETDSNVFTRSAGDTISSTVTSASDGLPPSACANARARRPSSLDTPVVTSKAS